MTINKGKQIDLSKALVNPDSVFESPDELRDCSSLTIEQKIEILRRWAYDESELSVAEEEGMTGGELSIIDRVCLIHLLEVMMLSIALRQNKKAFNI